VFSIAGKQLPLPQQLPHGINNRGQLQIAGGDFVQHRGKNKEVIPVHKRDINVRFLAQSPFQF
jgi:hypothetical protein